MSHSMCDVYLDFGFQNLDSKVFILLFLFLLFMNYCVVIYVYLIKPLQPGLVPICPFTHTTHVPTTCIQDYSCLVLAVYPHIPACILQMQAGSLSSFHLSVCLSMYPSIHIHFSHSFYSLFYKSTKIYSLSCVCKHLSILLFIFLSVSHVSMNPPIL